MMFTTLPNERMIVRVAVVVVITLLLVLMIASLRVNQSALRTTFQPQNTLVR